MEERGSVGYIRSLKLAVCILRLYCNLEKYWAFAFGSFKLFSKIAEEF